MYKESEKKCEALISKIVDKDEDIALYLESVGQLERWAIMTASLRVLDDPDHIDVRDYIWNAFSDEWWDEHAAKAVEVARERIETGNTKVITI